MLSLKPIFWANAFRTCSRFISRQVIVTRFSWKETQAGTVSGTVAESALVGALKSTPLVANSAKRKGKGCVRKTHPQSALT
jgi:hypothetical protein